MAAIPPLADPGRWRCILPPLPKRHSRGRASGFCGGAMVGATVGSGWREVPCWWPLGQPQTILVEGRKYLSLRGGRDDCIAGFWSGTGGDRHGALGWRLREGALALVDLHPPGGWESTHALGAGGGCWAGYGRPLATKGRRPLDQALCWDHEGRLRALPPLEEDEEAMALATDGVQVAGHADLGGGQRAVCWPVDGSQVVLLGEPGTISEAVDVAEGEQVGFFWSRGGSRAALWRGSPGSLVDLTPRGIADARALGCGGGYQCGSVSAGKQRAHAALWNGSAMSFVDLHALLPAPWNSSQALAVGVFAGVLRVAGEAQQLVFENEGARNESYFQSAQVPVLWETQIA